MPINVTCACGAQFRVKDEHAGRLARCPTCGAEMTIEAAAPLETGPTAEDHGGTPDFPEIRPAADEPVLSRGGRSARKTRTSGSTLLGMNRTLGTIMLLSGLVTVLFSRGCNSISGRSTLRDDANYRLVKNEFDDKNKGDVDSALEKIDELKEELRDLEKRRFGRNPEGGADPNAGEVQRLRDQISNKNKDIRRARESLSDLADEASRKKKKLERGKWRDRKQTARDSSLHRDTRTFWLEWLFLIGTIVLSIGLLTVGFTGQGTEKTICLIMIAIITFSIYIGGTAWIDNVFDTVRAREQSKVRRFEKFDDVMPRKIRDRMERERDR